jgi:hypothetical protein
MAEYSIEPATGIVRRTADNVQIAPSEDSTSQSFLDYLEWVNAGNIPDTIEVSPLEALRVEVKDEINKSCDYEMQTRDQGIISKALHGAHLDCREIDILRISQLINMMNMQGAPDNYPINFICYGNVITQTDLAHTKLALIELTQTYMNMLYGKHSLYAQLAAATTIEGVNACRWSWTPPDYTLT